MVEATSTVKTVEIPAPAAKPVVELWDLLSEEERAEFRQVARELRDSISTARNAAEAKDRALIVIEKQPTKLSSTILDYLDTMKKHAWDDRTWAQRLAFLSLIATLPVSGKAAGLAALGTAVRVSIPVVGAAAAALLGSGLDLASSTYRNLFGDPSRSST